VGTTPVRGNRRQAAARQCHHARRAETIEKSHGRFETRQIETTASLSALLAPLWTGVAQIVASPASALCAARSIETVYAITSLSGPQQLLALSRAH